MCGIIGYIGSNNCFDFIVNGLYQLQNRGYDSTGIASIKDGKYLAKKILLNNSNGDGIETFKKYKQDFKNCNIGIGHTRWATHGKISIENTHPHFNNLKDIAIVHNGVIHNYLFLKKILKNYKYYSETDTEVIANLLDYNKSETNYTTIKKTIEMIEGTFSLLIIFLNEPDKIYITKRGSPLLLAHDENNAILTSEESGFNGFIKNYIRIDDNDIYDVSYKDKIYIKEYHSIKKNIFINNDFFKKQELSYKPYNNWTEREIFEQDKSILNCLNNGGRIKNDFEVLLGGLESYKDQLKEIDNLILLGCGSSYYSGLLGKYYFQDITNLNIVLCINACEFELNDIPKFGKTAIIFISQSGETMDLYKILKLIKDKDILKIGIVNTVNSTISNETDCGIYLNIGKERGVASTKSFTSQCILLFLLSIYFSQIHDIYKYKRKICIDELKTINNKISLFIKNINTQCKHIAEQLSTYNNLFIIGKHQSEVVALEGSLKIKEITYIHSEGYSASMLKHGPFSLLSKDTPVLIIIPNDIYYDKTYSVLEQIKSRGSPIYIISDKYIELIDKKNTIITPTSNKLYSILNIIPIQIISYYISILKGINPDFPRNLAKVVTVE